ncbi:hypothetical protein HYALB_00000470 [Hymenoscyphus albidus]|uniref:Uncharacterized protein n=1 Tax=Hymenoscyphus albidus TaxID=595503 RepID=A0A9N9LGA1_9HELO|nr:hypothetical protein HYALB_00000470 [Hymenoscyphus albidus]
MNTIKAIIRFIQLRSRAQAQLPDEPTEPVLPVEILRQIWQESFVPRTVVFRHQETMILLGLSRGVEDLPAELPSFPQGPGQGRQETDRYYNKLSLDASHPEVLFNPEIDTLAMSPYRLHHFWKPFPKDTRKNGVSWAGEKDMYLPTTLAMSMVHLRSMLHQDHENLASTQAIAVGNVRWSSGEVGTPGNSHLSTAGFLNRFEASIQNSFQNLSKIILVRPTTQRQGFNRDFTDSLGSEAGRDLCRQQIREIYERLRERDPEVKVPEVIILNADDPQAPDFDPHSDQN